MGLAGIKVKQKFGLDPRNTNWSNDTDRFGHQYLQKMGWSPGKGLGLVDHATVSHVKVSLKDDNVGLGAKLHKKQKKDEFDVGECAGLDAFQRILGRLNGKEDAVSSALEQQRKDRVINGKWGMHFVKGAVLSSTWDSKSKSLRESNDSENEESSSKAKSKESRKKRKRLPGDDSAIIKKKIKDSHRSDKAERLEEKASKKSVDQADKDDNTTEQSTRDKKSSEVDGKVRKHKTKTKVKKEKRKEREENFESSSDEGSGGNAPRAIASRLSVRSKWIKQKRASVMDEKALNEIFMISK